MGTLIERYVPPNPYPMAVGSGGSNRKYFKVFVSNKNIVVYTRKVITRWRITSAIVNTVHGAVSVHDKGLTTLQYEQS